MELLYRNATFPKNDELLNNISKATVKLYNKLNGLDINSLNISDYNKRYLGNHFRNLKSTLQRYSYLLTWSIANTSTFRDDFVFMEYGGGCGILSLMARELGINTIIYNDIYDVSCNDARIIAETIDNRADDYVCGDIDILLDFVRANQLSCSAIVSNDVIEHIYNIESFLQKLSQLSESSLNVVMATGANPFNPIIKRRLAQQQREIEYKDRQPEWGHKKRDCLKAYFNARKDIISNYAPTLTEPEMNLLSMATRGLIKPVIERCVKEYLETKQITKKPDHQTNTCDPYTGNWAEHLMDISRLQKVLSNSGFKAQILCGYYGSRKTQLKRNLGYALNFMISSLKRHGLFISPFFILYGRKVKDQSQ